MRVRINVSLRLVSSCLSRESIFPQREVRACTEASNLFFVISREFDVKPSSLSHVNTACYMACYITSK